MEAASERAPRYELRVPLRFTGADVKEWANGGVVNISRSGFCFLAEHKAEVGTELRCRLDFGAAGYAPSVANIDCKARIVRTERAETRWGMGAKLLRYRFVPRAGGRVHR
ncbi:MAG: PilZ domain-containing protein [Terriglobales bacterium]